MDERLEREIGGLSAVAADHAARHERIPKLRYPPGIRMAVKQHRVEIGGEVRPSC